MIVQRELKLSDARVKRPCVDRCGARAILDVDDWLLDSLLDLGAVRGVINLASQGADRRELRFSVVCLEEYKLAKRNGEEAPKHTTAELAELFFGLPEPYMKARRIYSRLGCNHAHFYALADQRVIVLAKKSEQRTGPGGSAVVEWDALLKFIEKRRVA